ncbi:MAG: helicase HerA-like domain-containing protein [Candidatus Woesearchaeota archaeon]
MSKRYSQDITFDLVKKNEKSIYLGKIAESGIFKEKDFYFNIDEFTKHAFIAGSTGGGKTITAQIIAEEAFSKGISILVIDPTAQWTGFIKKLDDNMLFKRYRYFDMKKEKAKSYPTNIIKLKKDSKFCENNFFEENSINVLIANDLTEKEIDEKITELIDLFFKKTPEESQELKLLLFFEEVHRILPKYGGSGNGLIALERAVREFRKWGIGIILISQILEDFVGEIRANIGTEFQHRTVYEVDLEKIKLKYGDEIVKAVVRLETGTLMFHNSSLNIGKPLFIKIKPPLHNVNRLNDTELKEYLKIKEIIMMIEKSEKLKNFEKLKLAKNELIKGNFQIAEKYLKELNI